VNQGNTYPLQRAGGYLFASSASGSGKEVPSWNALKEMSEGDVVFHYADGFLRALGIVQAGAVSSSHPPGEEAGAEVNADLGFKVSVDYRDFEAPIDLQEIPPKLRVPEKGPFTRGSRNQGQPQQGYAFPLANSFVLGFRKTFEEQVPFDPWEVPDSV
jgi:hypothetical protein